MLYCVNRKLVVAEEREERISILNSMWTGCVYILFDQASTELRVQETETVGRVSE